MSREMAYNNNSLGYLPDICVSGYSRTAECSGTAQAHDPADMDDDGDSGGSLQVDQEGLLLVSTAQHSTWFPTLTLFTLLPIYSPFSFSFSLGVLSFVRRHEQA
jgi:hypothetical protein